MTKTQFVKALDRLGLTVASQATARALGCGVRNVQRIASGEQQASETMQRLLAMYARHGIPPELTEGAQ